MSIRSTRHRIRVTGSPSVDFEAALEELQKLPIRVQQVVLANSQVWRRQDVADILGISRQRVAQVLVEAAIEVAALNERRTRPIGRSRRRDRPVCASSSTIRRSG